MIVGKIEIRPILADVDMMGIVYHANYIAWFEKGRTELMREMGYPYSRLSEEGIWLPVAEVQCKYKSPALYDEAIILKTWVQEIKGATIILAYEIVRKETGEVCVTGQTKLSATNPDLKPVRLKRDNPEFYKMLELCMSEDVNA